MPPARRNPERIADGVGFSYDSVRRFWTCRTCGACVNNYLKHGAWHARLQKVVMELRHLIVVTSEMDSDEFVAALGGDQDSE